MRIDTNRCWQAHFKAETYLDPISGPKVSDDMKGTGFTGAFVPEIGPIRLPEFADPTMVHIWHNGCVSNLKVRVDRIVECPAGCEMNEYKYEICKRDTPHFLLPAGLYEITICSQMICELEEGDTFEGSVLLETVGKDFAQIFRINEGCC